MAKYNFYPKPWQFKELKTPTGEQYLVVDAKGMTICSMYWPCHSTEDEEKAVNEVEALAKAIADLGNADREPLWEDDLDGYCYTCDEPMLKGAVEYLAGENVCCSQQCVDDYWASR